MSSQDPNVPLLYVGKGGSRLSQYNCSDQGDSGICEVWSKDLSDYSYALAFYNSVSKQCTMFVCLYCDHWLIVNDTEPDTYHTSYIGSQEQ